MDPQQRQRRRPAGTLQRGSYLTVGGDNWNSNGDVADFQLYNTVLTPLQIRQLYAGSATTVGGGLPATTRWCDRRRRDLRPRRLNQTVASLSDGGTGGGGTVTNSGVRPGARSPWRRPAARPPSAASSRTAPAQIALTLNGTGTQVLAGSNTYTGLTTITAGTLQIGSGGTTGSINSTSGVVDNGLLAFNRSDTAVFGVPVSGSGGLTQMGPGTLILTGSETFTGPTTVSGGTLAFNYPGRTALTFASADQRHRCGAADGRHFDPRQLQHLHRPDDHQRRHAATRHASTWL